MIAVAWTESEQVFVGREYCGHGNFRPQFEARTVVKVARWSEDDTDEMGDKAANWCASAPGSIVVRGASDLAEAQRLAARRLGVAIH
jgi:hypothetical protein